MRHPTHLHTFEAVKVLALQLALALQDLRHRQQLPLHGRKGGERITAQRPAHQQH